MVKISSVDQLRNHKIQSFLQFQFQINEVAATNDIYRQTKPTLHI